MAYWADILATFDYRIAEHYAAQAALDAISELFSLMGLLSLAFIFLRTAIALLYDLSGGAKPGLARIVNLAGGAGLAVLIILAIIVWAVFVWYLDRIGQEDVSSPELQNAFYAFEKIAVAYEWIYFAFATIYLPIVFLQVLGGHRTDKVRDPLSCGKGHYSQASDCYASLYICDPSCGYPSRYRSCWGLSRNP